MSLSTLIAADLSGAILNTSEFASTVTHRPGVDAASVSGVFMESPELESVRRAILMTSSADVTPLDGDKWLVGTDVWRTLHTNTEFGANNSYLHLQLPTLVQIRERGWMRADSGSHRQQSTPLDDNWRAKIVTQDAELQTDERHRRLDTIYIVYFEERPTDIGQDSLIIEQNTDVSYRVIGFDQPEEFNRLFRAFVELER